MIDEPPYPELPPPGNYVRNRPVLDAIDAALLAGDAVIELVGGHGTGKTTLLQFLLHERPAAIDGAIELLHADRHLPLTAKVDAIAQRFVRSPNRNLLIIDEAESMDRADMLGAIDRLSAVAGDFTTIVSSVQAQGVGRIVHLMPLGLSDMGRLLEGRLRQTLPDDVLGRLWAASQGVPRLADILARQWSAGDVGDLHELAALFDPIAVPGLVDPNGRPLRRGGREERRIVSDVRFVSDDLLRAVGREPELAHALSSREFEELSAELFARQGYEVTLTPQTRDGGKDLYLAKADGFGSFLYIVECKKNAPDNPVGVGVVRSLYGVAQHERVTAAMTLTTSYFSDDAIEYAAKIQYQMALKDFVDLKLLLAPHGRN